MPKKKNSMALFEVISKIRDKNPDSGVLIPEWVRPNQQDQQDQQAPAPLETKSPEPTPQKPAPQAQAEPESTTYAPAQDQIEAPETPETPEAPDAPETQETQETPEAPIRPVMQTTSTWEPRQTNAPETSEGLPIWSTNAGKLTLSLNYVSCMVVSMGVLLTIVAAFVLGRVTAPSGATPAQTKQTTVKRVAGKYYMMIAKLADEGEAAMAEANRMAAFCNANGEPADVKILPKVVNKKVVTGKGNLIVWSATPFDSPSDEEVIDHALFVQNELGAKYAKQYGLKDNKFIQPQKNRKPAPVLFPYKPTKE